jgi:MFS family permease
MGISFTFIAIGSNAITTQEVSFITDMKISATVAAAALGITFGIGAISSLVSGWLADRIISRYVAILFFLLAIIGMLILIQADTMSKIWLFVVIFGVGVGALGTLLPIVTRDIFGAANFSALFGFTAISFAVGNAIGPPLAGFMFCYSRMNCSFLNYNPSISKDVFLLAGTTKNRNGHPSLSAH